MATYKAEFLAHYYVAVCARAGLRFWLGSPLGTARVPGSWFGQCHRPKSSVRPDHQMDSGDLTRTSNPTFSDETFQSWFHTHKRSLPLAVSADKLKRHDLSSPVLLWADTFNNYFSPHIAQAAVDVLESLGHPVMVPKASLCCGRPLYDYGMLPLAKKMLQRILSTLKPQIESGMPIVVWNQLCGGLSR